ncbi:MAG: redoxin domain-containing protein [Candidatus Brocadiae bacterium]|nr:redoxin domain-containing protein [Candidatus Brocadiia bacterium]
MKTAFVAALPAVFLAVLALRPGAQPPPGAPGAQVGDFTLKDAAGTPRALSSWAESRAVVLVFTSTQCPICNRMVQELNAIAADFAARKVAVVGINPNRNEQDEIRGHAAERGLAFPVLCDPDQAVADRLGIETVPTVVVLDATRTIRYRGRVDDDPMGGRPSRRDLRLALEDVLAGREVATPTTEPRGCAVRRTEPPATGEVTWTRDVAPIVHRHCVSCHRQGQIAPMPLTDFEHAGAFAREIRSAVSERRMPPWKASAGVPMKDDRRMTEEEIATLVRWADLDAPRGDPKDEPPLPEFRDEWTLGTPDLILEAPEFELSAQGPTDEYRHFVIPTDLPEDVWVSATDIRPGNARVVHHVLAYIDTSGTAEKLDAKDPGVGYSGEGTWPGFLPSGEMGGWAPGETPRSLPDGIGRRLRKGARVVLQVHYNRSGTAQTDRTRLGLYFSKTPVRQQIRWAEIVNWQFELPPGDAAHAVTARWKCDTNVTIYVVSPHQHLLGKSVKTEAILPDGTRTLLIEIADWDFKWQGAYVLQTPLKLPKGSIIEHTAVYDNSEANPRNPNRPPRPVRWGEKTTDEMCLGYVGYVEDREDLTRKKKKEK